MKSSLVSSIALAAALAAFVGAPSSALACQCSAQIAQAVTSINGNTNSVVAAMQAAIAQAIAQSTVQLSAVARQQTAAHEKMKENEQELEKLRATNSNAARIRDDQKMTPAQVDQYCTTLTAGRQAGAATAALTAMAADMQRRGEERNNYTNTRSSAKASLEAVYANYCDAAAEAAGVCRAAPLHMRNADISARNLMHGTTLATDARTGASIAAISDLPLNEASANAAARFCETVSRPVIENATIPPKPGDDPTRISAYLRERNQAQRANLVQQYCSSIVANRLPTIAATPEQQAVLREQYAALPADARPTDTMLSYNQLIALEVDRRFGRDANKWAKHLATNKSAADMGLETNLQLALTNRLLLDLTRTVERGFAMQMVPAATDANTVIMPGGR